MRWEEATQGCQQQQPRTWLVLSLSLASPLLRSAVSTLLAALLRLALTPGCSGVSE